MPGTDASLLREVSRSFFLSLRVLPRPMRRPVSLAYLIARASDTLADTPGVPAAEKLPLLEGFRAELEGGCASWRKHLEDFIRSQRHAGERALIQRLDDLFAGLEKLPGDEARHVREVAMIIVGGQRLDVERFAGGGALLDADSLEDYCHRVAGCVGLFWTRIGFATLGGRFSSSAPGELEAIGERFGRGLQLVNILRDLPGDLEQGRCYLPTAAEPEAVMKAAEHWRGVARQRMNDGLDYAKRMRSWRLRVAVGLPALLGVETLDLLDAADWDSLRRGVKVDRRVVRRCLWRSIGLR